MSQQLPPGPTDQELMLWVDGELGARRASEVANHVQRDPRARAIVAALRLGSDIVESDAVRRAGLGGADGIADAVMDNIEAEASRRFISTPRRAPLWRLPAITATGFALAAAAVWALMVRTSQPVRPGEETAHAPSVVDDTTVTDARTASIEVVDFGARPGMIFYVPSEGESAMAVVWLTDDDSSPTSGESQ